MTSSKDNIDEKDEGGTQPPKEEKSKRTDSQTAGPETSEQVSLSPNAIAEADDLASGYELVRISSRVSNNCESTQLVYN